MEMEYDLVTKQDELLEELIKICMPEFDATPDWHGVDYDFI